ncbi:nickel-containing superoxide dismutase [delta proteobacterium NaphS2]|nr:nickel-containing superoxide dismutase [delta proteobacterium NaphS2]
MKKIRQKIFWGILLVLFSAGTAAAHCEIPCGIYDDHMRIHMISEHITTIEKSMNQIVALQKETPINYNQLVRWIVNKEDHADQLQEIVSQYFMTQRIKTDRKNYAKELSLLHQMLVYAMKCKQTTDLTNTEKLRSLVKQFEDLYFGNAH